MRLHDMCVKAVSVTYDGTSCHFSMMKSLGANIDILRMDPCFPHLSDISVKFHIILDICNMLKLLRNVFADIGILKTSSGEYIR